VYLVDTDVISAGAPSKHPAPLQLIRWMDENSDLLFISCISVAEIEEGIAKARRQGARGKAERLDGWLETLLHLYGERVLPFEVAAARIAGRLSDRARAHGVSPGFADLAIAATATAHRFTVLTRNIRHFAPLGIAVHDPFASLPDR
jgi:predicted nucleic acid-binding protein